MLCPGVFEVCRCMLSVLSTRLLRQNYCAKIKDRDNTAGIELAEVLGLSPHALVFSLVAN